MAVQDALPGRVGSGGFAALNDQRVRGAIFQVLLVIGIISFGWWIIHNTAANLRAQGIGFGFDILFDSAGFQINQALIEYQETSSYVRVYFVGLINTLVVSFIGILLATLIGFIVGIARLSTNWVVAKAAYVYIEILRNIPLLLQIFIWYFAVLRLLPPKREAIDLGPLGLLNIAGWYAPKVIYGPGFPIMLSALIFGIVATFIIRRWAYKRQMATGEQFPVLWTGLALIIAVPIVSWFAVGILMKGAPLSLEYASEGNFGPRGGARVYPEFIGLLFALSFYTASFIAEIVRAGILAVAHGQTEAAYSLGLRPGHTLRLVVVPQAMRVIVPPLTSQYLNLTKNSSLAVAIAYPDLVSVFAGTALNQTGRAVEFILVTMATYLVISLVTSAFMNWYNSSVALVER
ncbi:amino acid ABC transporter permease [Afifella sp. IM 167]|uniref:amino acid ABC transporter permease n=1 Tax=Afifella sp. IM 167 TaxID=2033586 RepID=UPI001CC982D4|nr:amino acid ABC transporter permease [Afifella sp. IM 167]MBZ8132445.1 amino acid ABC transporter permease [Afifella sp. IM 167]